MPMNSAATPRNGAQRSACTHEQIAARGTSRQQHGRADRRQRRHHQAGGRELSHHRGVAARAHQHQRHGAADDQIEVLLLVDFAHDGDVSLTPYFAAVHTGVEVVSRHGLVLRHPCEIRLQGHYPRPHIGRGYRLEALAVGDYDIHQPATPISPSPEIDKALAELAPPTRKSAASIRNRPYQS